MYERSMQYWRDTIFAISHIRLLQNYSLFDSEDPQYVVSSTVSEKPVVQKMLASLAAQP